MVEPMAISLMDKKPVVSETCKMIISEIGASSPWSCSTCDVNDLSALFNLCP